MTLKDIEFATSTALVTGGSSGIGYAIAEELVERGVRRLILVAQHEDKLTGVAAAMEASKPGLSVRTIKADLSDREGPARVQQQILEWDWSVDLLVNNAGFARKYVFAENPKTDTSLANIDLMVRAVVDLSLRFLPGMVKRGSGGILNVGSTAGFQPVPFTAMYAASKAFVISFSQAIREEQQQRETGVRVACVVPGVTQTNLDGQGHGETRGPIDKVGIDQPADVAKVAVDTLEKNSAAQIVGWNNKTWQAALNLLPDSTTASVIASARGAPEKE
ncbi:nadp-dependent l-serine l-allo-threonine dehydrogenase ydfg [Stagonosporopsis vannaccii]|nr:nadp-dependent l-serine l-allo-threonine dehydrogenase ydfg [Stagonosporopsis vannaccii]